MTTEEEARRRYRGISRGVWIVVGCGIGAFVVTNTLGALVVPLLYRSAIGVDEKIGLVGDLMAFLGVVPFVFLLLCSFGVWGATRAFPLPTDRATRLFGLSIRTVFVVYLLIRAVHLPLVIGDPDADHDPLWLTSLIFAQALLVLFLAEFAFVFFRERQPVLASAALVVLFYFFALRFGLFEPLVQNVAAGVYLPNLPSYMGVDQLILHALMLTVWLMFGVLLVLFPLAVRRSLRARVRHADGASADA